jgi:flavin reductase (DIM6/NTAB) family NADH-FMN oxidoreductase RutF
MVRPSRYTYEFIEETGVFCVNVPSEAMSDWVMVCGTRSGRDLDKFGDYDMGTTPGEHVDAPVIDDCPMVYECRVVHTNDLVPATLDPQYDSQSYPEGDYHRFYYGEILGAYASENY